MKRNYHRLPETGRKRTSNAMPIFITAKQQNGRRMSTFMNAQRRSSMMSQISSPHGAEYRPQQRLPPNGLESQQNILLTNNITTIQEEPKQIYIKQKKERKPSQYRFLSKLCCIVDNESQYAQDFKHI
ncbi:unnamed protein product [Rotaria magnacalcarata]|uniref:Uncharacterized protein n=1 Tax=Rotaria magnacalcarata TaxID=392030 RepID=A0A816MYN6_9BILA|nr:unnamed protein product [Rotaria magnacalcarata]CAF2163766.1 unnamed protein product [Rotaria magnacalcarata]CAF2165559.1 unnamed protein product [Rotaria magnacalcarata]CAF3991202.1 unnamed protein product [Rotaria magnacalcarata]CAF4180932.1 unnamed protein product [Rotaria magnacalcarata]